MNYNILKKIIRPITNFIWPVTIINANKFVETKGVYVCNHYSMIDPVPFFTDLFQGKFGALMKEEACNYPILGKILLDIGAIPVKRGEADLRAMKRCLDTLREEKPLIVFPEGKRNLNGGKEMLEFKEGPAMFALKTDAPVIPMLYYRPIKPFRRTYLIIGNKIDLAEFKNENQKDARVYATNKIKNCMCDLRVELDSLVGNKQVLKALLREQKAQLKQIKKMQKDAKRKSKNHRKSSIDAVVEE